MAHESQPILVEIIALVEDDQAQSPLIALYDKESNRILPIWIGDAEARAIAILLNNISTPRPLTHALLANTIRVMGGQLLRVVIDRLEEHTYYATIHIDQGGNIVTIDARPSDSIAIALQSRIPLFVEKIIMDIGGQINVFPIPPQIEKQLGPRKIQLTKQDIERLSETLKQARERESQS